MTRDTKLGNEYQADLADLNESDTYVQCAVKIRHSLQCHPRTFQCLTPSITLPPRKVHVDEQPQVDEDKDQRNGVKTKRVTVGG